MVVSEELIEIIDSDIKTCELAIQRGNKDELWEVHSRLVSKYSNIIDGFAKNLQSLFYDESGNIKKQNLETMRQKLVLFKAMGYKNIFSSDAKGTQVSVNNVNQNTLLNNISFEDARNNIENMTALREEEINDIFEKIDEIEKLVLSTERKTKKWENSKYLRKYIYQIDSTTMATENELNGKVLLNTNLKLRKSDEPQILIYHTHGSEAYRGSRKGRKSDTVIGVGDVLTKRLEQKNIKVVHDRNIYDVKNGKEERSKAYNYAATAIEKNLKKYPSIQVVIDLHRDGVNESTKLVTRQNGKRMAQIMFFNGMSRTATNGNIKYLKNPNKQTNLAFSLQLQAQAALKYPGFTRKIYVKGYRYNLHYRGRSLLVEVGAQNNTLSEAKASMSLLAELLNNVLY